MSGCGNRADQGFEPRAERVFIAEEVTSHALVEDGNLRRGPGIWRSIIETDALSSNARELLIEHSSSHWTFLFESRAALHILP